jgi:hypothetical protein
VSSNCPKCGAAGKGFVCAYCGGELSKPGDENAEMTALEEFHEHVKKASKDADRCALLITGWYPRSPKALIECGARCLPHLDVNDTCHLEYKRRLDAIVSRLRLAPQDDHVKSAAAELAARSKAYDDQTIQDVKVFLGFAVGLLLAFVYGGWRAYLHFFAR